MARLQILELPTEHHGDDMITPFVLVVDQADETTLSSLREQASRGIGRPLASIPVAEQIGARTVLAFEETIEIPANDPGAYETSRPETHLTLDGREFRADSEQHREQIREGILYAQGKITRAVDGQQE